MGSLIDLTGQRFGRLEVLRRQKNAPSGQTRYLVLCDCGKTKVTQRNLLVSGNTNSCGCYNRSLFKRRNRLVLQRRRQVFDSSA